MGKRRIDFRKVDELKERTKQFTLSIIELYRKLPATGEARIIGGQLLRCGTSVGANYRAACRGRSDREFYAKLCIVVEEADESLFWLEVIRESEIIEAKEVISLLSEADELLSIMASSKKTAGKRLGRK